MTPNQYITEADAKQQAGNATEHTFRGLLEQLIESIAPGIRATNEPKRQACGAPDYILTKNDLPIGFIEAKNIGDGDLEGLKKTGNKEQFDRYKAALGNLIFTDYLEFHLYRDGEFSDKIAIGEIAGKGIKPLPENFPKFINLIKSFCANISISVSNPQKLAGLMAAKARLLADVIEKSLVSDEISQENSTLKDQLEAFKLVLIHDIDPRSFADVYAQTIAYGMFAARLHDPALPVFSRQKAYELIPKSNPFLKKLFGYIAGLDLDDRIKWVVDDLVNIFLACNVAEILNGYGKETQTEDPIIHFYETFLGEYDPKQRKARGVWYTPAPVVKFIVRAVDDILKTDFGLPDGLADISLVQPHGHAIPGNAPIHKVQILDPATGTGTFLAETVKHIYKGFEGREGMWGDYVDNHLLPRLNGFELLMASYAMAHLKLDLLLAETGHKPAKDQRFRIYLTNSLEESHPDTQTLFANWLSDEANAANRIKREVPVMCVIGNPPYAVSSSNKGDWIQNLIGDYKKGLNEKKINLDDDYIKFIRLGQHFIDKNGSGILAFITNNSFIDGITHRQMRKSLAGSFDKIYILNLHGSAKKKETCPDGSPDHNVFDIMQGVSINIFVKTGNKANDSLGEVFYADLQGKRKFKYENLVAKTLETIAWERLKFAHPNYFFAPKNFDQAASYEKGFKANELFMLHSNGIETKCDALSIHFDRESLNEVIGDFKKDTVWKLKLKYKNKEDSGGWNFEDAKNGILAGGFLHQKIQYRPFDVRETIITKHSGGFIGRSRFEVMQHFLHPNVGLIVPRQTTQDWRHVFVTDKIIEGNITATAKLFGAGCVFPLYIYPDTEKQAEQSEKAEHRKSLELRLEESLMIFSGFKKTLSALQKMYDSLENPDEPTKELLKSQLQHYKTLKNNVDKLKKESKKTPNIHLFGQETRIPNLNKEIVKQMADKLGLVFVPEKQEHSSFIIHNSFSPIDVFDYVYAVLHSPAYREKYNEFLKIDFPRIPYPKNKETFWILAGLGGQIRRLHLLESPGLEQKLPPYPVKGGNEVINPRFEDGKVYINDAQYFDRVPQTVWQFYVGGYQPAQKWLKDRKGRSLGFPDILHYQKTLAALSETGRMMEEIGEMEMG